MRGKLTLHGVTRDVETAGKIVVKGGRLKAAASFNVLLADYDITVPAMVKDNISKSINIAVDCSLDALKN